jgi:plastocyanin domain-containing protein
MKNTTLLLIAGLILIGIIGYIFVGSGFTGSATSSGDIKEVTLTMNGYNYSPAKIEAKVGQTIRIHIEDSVGGCYRYFTIRSFGIAKNLATEKDYVEITPTKAGTYQFACGMGMAKGVIIVS